MQYNSVINMLINTGISKLWSQQQFSLLPFPWQLSDSVTFRCSLDKWSVHALWSYHLYREQQNVTEFDSCHGNGSKENCCWLHILDMPVFSSIFIYDHIHTAEIFTYDILTHIKRQELSRVKTMIKTQLINRQYNDIKTPHKLWKHSSTSC